MKFVFLLICLLFQSFSYASVIGREVIEHEGVTTRIYNLPAQGSFFGIVDSGLSCIEKIEDKIPSSVKWVGNIGIDLCSYFASPLQQVFLLIPKSKIVGILSNPITDLLAETKFVQEKIIDKIDQNIQEFFKDAKKDEDFGEILRKNPKIEELMKGHEKIAKFYGNALVSIPTSLLMSYLLKKIWHHTKPHMLNVLSKSKVRNGKDWMTILETIMTSRICFLPVQIHKNKHEIKSVFGMTAA